MSSSEERTARSFVERHGLWSDEQFEAAANADKWIEEHGLEVVRLSFPDQHGILRGKTVMANEAAHVMRNGCSITTTLLAKDTAHKTVFPVFTPGGGFGMPEMEGAGDFLMIADPTTFRVLPWAPQTGWVLCDIYFANGRPVPFSTRHLYRRALQKLAEAGFDYMAGLEVEFHVFKLDNPRLAPADATWPGEAPEVSLISQGYQYLTETRFDQMEPILETVRREIVALGLPLRSVEVELGPSQCEFTFHPQVGLSPADTMMLFRSAVKQICRRQGYHASFMARPEGGERDVERLAPAPIAARPALQRQRLHRRTTRSRCRGSGGISSPACSRMRARRPPSPRRPSTATSAIAATRWRPTARSGDATIAGVMIRVLGGPGDRGDAAREPGRRAGRQSVSLHGLADLHRSRRHGAHARSRPVGGHALRGAGAASAQEPRGGAARVAQRRLPRRRLRPQFHRLLPAHQGGRDRALSGPRSRSGSSGNISSCSRPYAAEASPQENRTSLGSIAAPLLNVMISCKEPPL